MADRHGARHTFRLNSKVLHAFIFIFTETTRLSVETKIAQYMNFSCEQGVRADKSQQRIKHAPNYDTYRQWHIPVFDQICSKRNVFHTRKDYQLNLHLDGGGEESEI